jgi:elongation factor Ts
MAIDIAQVRELRERTGAGVLDAKKALEQTAGDMDAAIQMLREKGLAAAAKKAGRTASDGRVVSYVHGDPGRIGVLVEVNCETDFVARTERFDELCRNIAMQIAAANPIVVRPEDLPEALVAQERDTYRAQMANENKPADIIDKIVDGKIQKWHEQAALLNQPYIRNPDITVGALVTAAIAELGENIVVRRFARFELGEGD